MQVQDSHIKGALKEHAHYPTNLHAHKRSKKPRLGYIYTYFCSLLHIVSCILKPMEPLVNHKPLRGKLNHKRKKKPTTLHNNILSTEPCSAQSEIKHACKYKNSRNKANPLHLVLLYNLIVQANITRGSIPQASTRQCKSQTAGRDIVQHTSTPSPLHPRHLIKVQHNNLTIIKSSPRSAQPHQHQTT
jgi:hypothetical protein